MVALMAVALMAAAAFLISHQLTRKLLDPKLALTALDYPNERSLHERPTPRGGGLAILVALFAVGTVAVVAYGASRNIGWLASGALVVAFVSFLDDRFHVHPGLRVSVHAGAAVLLMLGGLAPERIDLPGVDLVLPGWLGLPLGVLYVVWMVNLYNFMDGIDGLAAGMAVIGFGCFALMSSSAGHETLAAINAVAAAAAGGFLGFNFSPARIFMGDVGSSLLGFMAAALSLWAAREGIFPLWVGVLVFSPFVVDATVTLLLRAWRRERVWEAHRTHFYQRLVRHGWDHRRTALCEYVLMILCALSAVAAGHLSAVGQGLLLAAWTLVYVTLIRLIYGIEKSQH
jgi:UDP-N-acetylmuramyl pentapeptide phosphotransferase/UDP-N-acetylglucosamine-1-phosphate transferase